MDNIEHQYEVIYWLHFDDLEFDLEQFSRLMDNIEHQYEVIYWLHFDDLEFDLEQFSRSNG